VRDVAVNPKLHRCTTGKSITAIELRVLNTDMVKSWETPLLRHVCCTLHIASPLKE